MDNTQVTEGNKLIAEFDGWKFLPNGDCWHERYNDHGQQIDMTPNILTQYHTSWDWLLPCVKKFNDMVLTGDIEHDNKSSAIHDLLEISIMQVNITAAHNYFSQLIQWYNNQQSSIG